MTSVRSILSLRLMDANKTDNNLRCFVCFNFASLLYTFFCLLWDTKSISPGFLPTTQHDIKQDFHRDECRHDRSNSNELRNPIPFKTTKLKFKLTHILRRRNWLPGNTFKVSVKLSIKHP